MINTSMFNKYNLVKLLL